MERRGVVTFKGMPVTLQGRDIPVGDMAPNFTAIDKDMRPVKLDSLKGEIVIISVVPSLDTRVCELQTKRFNEEAAKLNVKLVTISMDLPFAQRRFCDSFKIENITMLSDYKDREFGMRYGMYVEELGLLARAVFIVDRDGKLAYKQIVKESGDQPDYDAVLSEARNLGA
ncbi:MAG TPA: thiol peroxidase [Spirochaetota bacterium]|nr:thiol peroxidase [Spirochaetota bacterium]